MNDVIECQHIFAIRKTDLHTAQKRHERSRLFHIYHLSCRFGSQIWVVRVTASTKITVLMAEYISKQTTSVRNSLLQKQLYYCRLRVFRFMSLSVSNMRL